VQDELRPAFPELRRRREGHVPLRAGQSNRVGELRRERPAELAAGARD
jgi:hypothetical protein